MDPVKTPKRVLLAVDLKAGDPQLTKRIWNALRPLLRNTDAIVEPVAVLNRTDIAVGNALRDSIGELAVAAEKHLEAGLRKIGLKGLSAPKVLVADGASTRRAVLALLKHAKATDCDLIAVSSHSRKGLKRAFLGSFAETLSLESDFPLLVATPHQGTARATLNSILFPTDFSPESKQALEIACTSLRRSRSKLILFHKYEVPVQFFLEPSSGVTTPQSVFDVDWESTEKLGQDWKRELRSRGIRCDLMIDRKSQSVLSGILTAVKSKKVGMIAMVSSTGKFGSRLGAITRQVIRSAPVPIWVVNRAP